MNTPSLPEKTTSPHPPKLVDQVVAKIRFKYHSLTGKNWWTPSTDCLWPNAASHISIITRRLTVRNWHIAEASEKSQEMLSARK